MYPGHLQKLCKNPIANLMMEQALTARDKKIVRIRMAKETHRHYK